MNLVGLAGGYITGGVLRGWWMTDASEICIFLSFPRYQFPAVRPCVLFWFGCEVSEGFWLLVNLGPIISGESRAQ